MNFEAMRRRMVLEQLESRGIQDKRVLSAFLTVPRHLFVPPVHRMRSYEDHPLPIGSGQTISQPYMVALMTQSLALRPGSKVLEIGTGSGYQTAILSHLGAKVHSIERIASLAESALRRLKNLGYTQVEVRVGDGSLGWPTAAPFDGILVAAATPCLPEILLDQLKEAGRLVVPIGSGLSQTLTVAQRLRGELHTEEVCGCVFVPLIGAHGFQEGEVSAEETV